MESNTLCLYTQYFKFILCIFIEPTLFSSFILSVCSAWIKNHVASILHKITELINLSCINTKTFFILFILFRYNLPEFLQIIGNFFSDLHHNRRYKVLYYNPSLRISLFLVNILLCTYIVLGCPQRLNGYLWLYHSDLQCDNIRVLQKFSN